MDCDICYGNPEQTSKCLACTTKICVECFNNISIKNYKCPVCAKLFRNLTYLEKIKNKKMNPKNIVSYLNIFNQNMFIFNSVMGNNNSLNNISHGMLIFLFSIQYFIIIYSVYKYRNLSYFYKFNGIVY